VRLLSVTLSLFGILAETEFSNPNYKSENLKINLEKNLWKKDNVYKDGDPREI
jgi:hypothetical protein